jgi:hypothetical protein
MKKLLYLFLVLAVIACSKDDSSEPQTFFQKYDGVVWQQNTSDYINRVQINNETNPTVLVYVEDSDGYSYCDSELVEADGELTEVNEDSFVLYEEYTENNVVYSYTITIAVSENGNQLTAIDSDDPDFPQIFSRTTLTEPCE